MKRLCGSAAMSLALALASGAVAPALFPAAAVAQENVSLEVFEAELTPYGEWFDHPRWGRVWAPNDMPQDWRPYTTGRWIWTDEHGWYWQADEEWGWIPFHYGRWAFDRRDGWLWVPGTVWGPAWVSWRETEDAYGWAPLPPEEEEEIAEADPVYWTFVAPRDFSAPRIYAVRLPPARVQIVFPRTRFVYRTTVRDRDNRPRGFNRGPDRVVVERRGNGRVDVRVVEPRFLDREIERRRGPNSAELQRFRERQREEGARIRVRVDEEGARRPDAPRGPDNAGGPRRGNDGPPQPGRAGAGGQDRRPGAGNAEPGPNARPDRPRREERQEQRQEREQRQEQRQEQQQERERRQEQRQQRQAEPPPRPDRRGPPPDAAPANEQPQTPRRREAPENAQPAPRQQQQERRQQQEEQQQQQPQRQEQQQQRQQRQEQRREQQEQRQQQQEQRQQRQEERQQRRNPPPANCTPGQPGC